MTEENQKPQSRSGEFERISPAYVRLDEPEAQPGYRPPENPMSTGIIIWALFGLLCLVAAVFLWLPGEIAEREQQPAPTPASVPATPPEVKSPEAETDTRTESETEAGKSGQGAKPADATGDVARVDDTLVKREKAETLQAEAAEMRDELRAAGAEKWAGEAWQGLNHLFDKGERELQARNFEVAAIAFGEARQSAENIEQSADEIFEEQMARGENRLEAGDSQAAMKAFDTALAVRPDDEAVLKARDRASKRDDVLEHMREGRNLETAEEIVVARDAYARAVELDAEYKPAVVARDRVQALINDRSYRARLSRGLQQMEDGDYGQARETLEAAERLRPGSSEVADALSQIDATQGASRTDSLKKKAQSAEQAGQWQEAGEAYKAILAEDPSLTFAQQGRERAADRADLHGKLAALLDKPGRLSDATVRDQANQLLERARAVESPGPRLSSQIDSLAQALKQAQEPVQLTLESDGQTRVVVHHIGEQGQFEQKTLELLPGDYTAVGSRPGFRDVRVNFSVEPGASSPAPVRVACQEKI